MVSTISNVESAEIRKKYIREFIESERDDSLIYWEDESGLHKIVSGDGSMSFGGGVSIRTNPDPPAPTKFWECEYCGTVNPIDLLDCRGKVCGHSITKKAMQAAFGMESEEYNSPVYGGEDFEPLDHHLMAL